MLAPVRSVPHNRRRAHIERGDAVPPAFWIVAVPLAIAMALQVPLNSAFATAATTVLFIVGGLPHGAYDIALLRRAVALDRDGLILAVGAYVALVVLMAVLWSSAPLVALVLFLIVAAVHFGEDWQMLDEPVLRLAAGAAIIAAPTLGHPAEVTGLFVAMSDGSAAVIARGIIAAAPVALLVTIVGIAVAWREGSRRWAIATTLCVILLVALPPVIGFALFFVFLHAPRHLAHTRSLLADMSRRRWLITGAALSGSAILGWWALRPSMAPGLHEVLTVQAFQLLAAVAVPHLMLSRWLERRVSPPCLPLIFPPLPETIRLP